MQVTTGKKTQANCEDQILRLLATAEGPLLDNLDLIETLDISKETYETVGFTIQLSYIGKHFVHVHMDIYRSLCMLPVKTPFPLCQL